jgi:hypothetical protein
MLPAMKWRVVRSGTKWRLITGSGDFTDKDGDALKSLAAVHNSQLGEARRQFTKARKR